MAEPSQGLESTVAKILDLDPHAHVAGLLTAQEVLNPQIDTASVSFPEPYAAQFDAAFGPTFNGVATEKQFVAAMADAKRAVAAWYARRLLEAPDASVAQNRLLGAVWTAFAEWSLDRACRFAVQQRGIARLLPTDNQEPLAGFFILGLGKLGGYDLNYSSDIDLIAFFDTDRFTVRPGQGKTDVAGRIAKAITQLLSGQYGPRIWRVDWRLRPDPSVTGLAMAADAALDFHFFHAAPWRRLAMMKARPVAGDLVAGRAFLKELSPFVWRKTLDYRALDDIAGIKGRIRDEHPGLDEERANDVPLDRLQGFHLKLGTGGIREIEFIANGLQLVWGGRTPTLQTVNTLEALKRLADADRLSRADAVFLQDAYCLLRGLENRVQMMADGHVHHVPESGASLALFLALNGSDEPTLAKSVKRVRRRVHDIFESLFSDQGAPVSKTSSEGVFQALSASGRAVVQAWQTGFQPYGLPASSADRMAPLVVSLLKLVADSDRPDETVLAFDGFFRSLPPGGQYLVLLAEHADLAADILEPLTGGGAMATLLRQSPHVVDTLVQRGGVARTTAEERGVLGAFVDGQRDYESQLEALRLHVNEMLYLAYLRLWRGRISPAAGRALLSDLAQEAVARCAALVGREYYGDGEVPGLSIAGYGKIGMGEMMPRSDLDIVFIAHGQTREDEADIEGAHRFSNRLKTALGTPMRGGIVYEIDTRLRPSGGSGAPTVRLSTLRTHQMERAKTWEHLALVPSKIIFGPAFVRQDFASARRAVLTRARDTTRFLRDCHAMLNDLRTHRIAPPKKDRLALKLVPGGLMEAEYVLGVMTILAAQRDAAVADLSFQELPQRLESMGLAPAGFAAALSHLQDAHVLERLYGWDSRDITSLPKAHCPQHVLSPVLGEDFQSVLDRCRALINDTVRTVIIEPSGLSQAALKKHPFERVLWAD
ncbi:MAG: hypothetical protein AAFO73_04515 [Pseudomonadota bacterium]